MIEIKASPMFSAQLGNAAGLDGQPLERKKKILLVDDDPQLRQLLGDRLEAGGYQVFFAANGREGIKQAQEKNPDVVLLDLEMPEMDGLTALAEIRKLDAAVPVIILTAHDKTTKAGEARRRGADDFLLKNNAPLHLLQAIQNALAKKRRQE